ncbi:MerR family transcriptional regulator [Rhodococcus sp. ABRD24]|uniref:MerR family transcriptional regulator n=1 Tax=Rhodococcus sp. ABRD24 TaxID=2507582 RepID=UPI00103F4EA8|nr:MerR family transcriptional regulator [Rhodococcus sp. ABRD24]QBJ98028.1 MerR family transcriptional regulator [Rhodococcus sp. ABRD24]
MRISDLAQAAGTTPRTIRHYHRLGLLDEPRRLTNGYREYELADLVRLMRVRWLARAGVPLGSVSSILTAASDDAAADDLEADLVSLIDTVEAERRTLAARSARLRQMLETHRAGRPMSPLPPQLALAFTDLITGEADPAVRREFERERDAWELVAISGSAPEEFFDSTALLLTDPQSRREIVRLYRRFAAVLDQDPELIAAEIDSVAEALESSVRIVLSESGLLEMWQADMLTGANGTMPLRDLVPDDAQRAVMTRLLDRLGLLPSSTGQKGTAPS